MRICEAADKFGVSRGFIYNHMRTGEIGSSKDAAGRVFISEEDVRKAVESSDCYREGYTKTEIARILGMSIPTFQRLVKQGYFSEFEYSPGHKHLTKDSVEKFMDEVTLRGDWKKDKYLSIVESSYYSGLSKSRIRSAIRKGDLNVAIKLPTRRQYLLKSELDEYLMEV